MEDEEQEPSLVEQINSAREAYEAQPEEPISLPAGESPAANAQSTLAENVSAQGLTAQQQIDVSQYNSTSLLVFGSFALILISAVVWTRAIQLELGDILKLYGTLIIVVLAAYLVVAGWSTDQITPVIGLLGTIAGYLLGTVTATAKAQSLVPESPDPKEEIIDNKQPSEEKEG